MLLILLLQRGIFHRGGGKRRPQILLNFPDNFPEQRCPVNLRLFLSDVSASGAGYAGQLNAGILQKVEHNVNPVKVNLLPVLAFLKINMTARRNHRRNQQA